MSTWVNNLGDFLKIGENNQLFILDSARIDHPPSWPRC